MRCTAIHVQTAQGLRHLYPEEPKNTLIPYLMPLRDGREHLIYGCHMQRDLHGVGMYSGRKEVLLPEVTFHGLPGQMFSA